MRFSLPDATMRNLGLVLTHQAPGVAERGLEAERPQDRFSGHGFSIGIPGQLGEYAGVNIRAEAPRPKLRAPEARKKEIPDAPLDFANGNKGRGSLLAQELVHQYRMSPAAFFLGLPYRPDYIRDYLGASNWLRSEAKRKVDRQAEEFTQAAVQGKAAKGRPGPGRRTREPLPLGASTEAPPSLLLPPHMAEGRGTTGLSRDLVLPGDFEWGEIGWTTPSRKARFDEALEVLSPRLVDSSVSVPKLLRALAQEHRGRDGVQWGLPEWESLYRAGLANGSFPVHDRDSREAPVAWDSIRASLLGMRLFTEEQVGVLAPWVSTQSLRYSLRSWATEGWVEPLRTKGLPMPIWKVTQQAIEDGLDQNLMSRMEAQKRGSIRATQELHDLAVGDALILVTMDLAVAGAQVTEVRTEISLMAERKTGTFPDFSVTYTKGGRKRDLDVEVVGLGNNYRTAAKGGEVRRAGFKVYAPGFDGNGARFV